MVHALLSHHSGEHFSCGAPVRKSANDTTAIPSNSLFVFPPSLSFPLFWLSVSSGNIPIYSSPAPSPLRLLPPSLPTLSPLLGAGGRRAITHHLVITGTKGALVALAEAARRAPPLGQKVEESPPPLPAPSSPPSSPPPQMMKTLSVRIRKEQCTPAEGITMIKVMPPHLCMSIPLSTYSLFVTLHQFGDSKPLHGAVMLPNGCYA